MSWRHLDLSGLDSVREADGSFFGKDQPAQLIQQLLHLQRDQRPFNTSQASVVFRELFFVQTVLKVLTAHPTWDFNNDAFLHRLTKALSKDKTAARLHKAHGLDMARAVARVVKKMCESRTIFENRPPPPPALVEPINTGAPLALTKAQAAIDARTAADKVKLQESIDRIVRIMERCAPIIGVQKIADLFKARPQS